MSLSLAKVMAHRTRIFTLDSMGSKHPAVGKTLRRYLEQEAEDKKSRIHVRPAEYKHATVFDYLTGVFEATLANC